MFYTPKNIINTPFIWNIEVKLICDKGITKQTLVGIDKSLFCPSHKQL